MTVGVISDTHGLLRPVVLDALRGCTAILHAGDIGSADILSQLEAVAPVHAVRGMRTRAVGPRRFRTPKLSRSRVPGST